jgi:hypothetical protein
MGKHQESADKRKRIAEMGACFIGGFCMGLRGEEMLLIELAGMANSLTCMLTLCLPFQKELVKAIKHWGKFRCALRASDGRCSSLPRTLGIAFGGHYPRFWLPCLEDFSIDISRSLRQEFENDFFTVLEKVQVTTNLFPEDLVIRRDQCGIAKTLCRTLTVHAHNMGIHIDLLKAINCWHTEYSSKTGDPCLDMPDVYMMLESLLPTYLQFLLVL